jgi:hypothetical protein
MASEDYIVNIDTSYLDGNGVQLLGNNEVLSVFYYNATASGTEETWVKDWNIPNTIVNYNFSTTVTGGVDWELVTDDLAEPYTCQICRIADWHNTDLIVDKPTTSSGYTFDPAYIVDYDATNGYETADGVSPGQYAVRIDMQSIQDVNYFWFIPCWGTDPTRAVKDYRIGISDTGGENEFTIVASGTSIQNSYAPEIAFLGNVQTRYLKIYIDSNWGHATRSRIWKASAFYEPDWSLFGYNNTGYGDGTDAYMQQIANLSEIDYLFFDARSFMSSSTQVGNLTVMASGVGGSTNDVLRDYNWGNTGTAWQDSNDPVPSYGGGGAYYWTRWEEQVDVSSYSNTAIKLRIYNESFGRRYFFGYFDNIQTSPLWYRESSSSTRGTKAYFPNEVYITSDRNGVSIIDKSDLTLWMRFNVGPGNILETAARDIYADEGKIYLTTSRGLVIVDFTKNKAWKYSESGLQYRMSLGRRNEYGFWFTEDAGLALTSDDVYSVAVGSYSGTTFIVTGTNAGMSYIVEETTVNNSSFKYPVRNIVIGKSLAGEAERVVYTGGFDSNTRVGSIETITNIQSDNFDEDAVIYSSDYIMANDTVSGTLANQWFVSNGNLSVSYGNNYASVSGVKNDYGDTTVIQKFSTPDRPFTATVDVKLDRWPGRMRGGLHFGVTSGGWPFDTSNYYDNGHSLMLSAVNGTYPASVQDESFSKFPNLTDQWQISLNNYSEVTVDLYENSYRVTGRLSGSYGSNYAPGEMLGTQRFVASPQSYFTAKVKVRASRMDADETGRNSYIIFGVTDGEFIGEGSGQQGLAMCIYGQVTTANPPVYCTASKASNGRWDYDISEQQALFTNDLTDNAEWHTWEFTYNISTKTLVAGLDGNYLATKTNASLGSSVGIVLGPASNGDDITVQFKDFEIDYGVLQDYQKEKYVVLEYDDGSWTYPTASGGTHLQGLPFSVSDGSYDSLWKTWEIIYDGTTLSGNVSGSSVGKAGPLTLSDNQRIFIAYDIPSTVSGTDKDTDIKFKNFTISYNTTDTVIEGIPSTTYIEKGTYLAQDYNTLYVSTTSGINQLAYLNSTMVSGTPHTKVTYGISGSSSEYKILHGNIHNCTNVEPESGAVLGNGLLYTGSSRYTPRGWERLDDRIGVTANDSRTSICTTSDGSNIFLFYRYTLTPSIYAKDTGVDGAGWYTIALGKQTEGFEDVQSRARMVDMDNGNIYCVGPQWFGVYAIEGTKWLWPTENLDTGPVYTGGGELFDDWEWTPSLSKQEIHFMHHGGPALYLLENEYWVAGKYRHVLTPPLGALDGAIVYSEVDDSLYVLQKAASNNFFRSPENSLVWSSALENCPYTYDFNQGIAGFYRPYDESVYFVMKGATDAYGRKIVRYDVKESKWYTLGVDVPTVLYDFMSAYYSYTEDALYVVAGEFSTRIYKYHFPHDEASRFVSWAFIDEEVLPENSNAARYRKISFDSEAGVPSDNFNDSSITPVWYQYSEGTGVSVTEDTSKLNFTCPYTTQHARVLLTRGIPVPACDFTATLQVKVNDMARSTGEIAGSRNLMMFGITDFLHTPGYAATGGGIEISLSSKGTSGVWMTAFNTESDDVNKYTLWKTELGSDTYYNASQYLSFNSSDATPAASYREWKLEYDHSAKQLDTYLDSVSVGSVVLSGDGFQHGVSLQIGAYRTYNAVSGTIDIDVKDLDITINGSTSLVSNYMKIDDNDEYGYQYYEKLDTTLTSGNGYTFESDWRVETYSITDNVYVTTLGSIEDGHRMSHLAALYTGDRRVGLYTGGDPRSSSSYSAVDHDWTVRSTYKAVSDSSSVKVYINDESVPSLNVSYSSLPRTKYRRSRFGTCNPDNELEISAYNRNEHIVLSSGTWTYDTGDESAYYGGVLYAGAGGASVDRKVITTFNDSGNGYLYMFYSAFSNRADNTPITIYHSGMLNTPTPDSYATNPINTVNDNIDEYGNADVDATTILLNQQKLADGSDHSRVGYGAGTPTGWVYLGRYTDIERVVVTCDNLGASSYIILDMFKIKHTDTQPRSKSVSRVYRVSYTIGKGEVLTESDFKGAFTVVDMNTKTKIDAYNADTSPNIIDSSINDFDVV